MEYIDVEQLNGSEISKLLKQYDQFASEDKIELLNALTARFSEEYQDFICEKLETDDSLKELRLHTYVPSNWTVDSLKLDAEEGAVYSKYLLERLSPFFSAFRSRLNNEEELIAALQILEKNAHNEEFLEQTLKITELVESYLSETNERFVSELFDRCKEELMLSKIV